MQRGFHGTSSSEAPAPCPACQPNGTRTSTGLPAAGNTVQHPRGDALATDLAGRGRLTVLRRPWVTSAQDPKDGDKYKVTDHREEKNSRL